MKKRKFITHVSMGCTREQYERDLKKPLKYLGYKDCNSEWYEGDKFITNNWDGKNSSIGSSHESLIILLGGYFIDHYNPELFLALAAMTEGEELIKGEYYIGKCIGDVPNNPSIIEFDTDFNRYNTLRRATKEELINHFAKDMKKETRFPFELDLEGARKIIDVACKDWKGKLRKKWSLLLDKPTILISESFYKEMRAACNDEQHKVLDSVFGKDEKSVDKKIQSIIIENSRNAQSCTGENYTTCNGIVLEELQKQLLETFDIKFKE